MSRIERFKQTFGIPASIFLDLVNPASRPRFIESLTPAAISPVPCVHCGVDIGSEAARGTHEVNFCEALT